MIEIKAFNRWSVTGIAVNDPGLKDYINLSPKIVPRTGAKYAGKRFYKSKVFIVERLMNKLMIPGHKSKKHFRTSSKMTGKASKAYSIIEKTFEIVEKQTNENPIKILVKAIENSATREEIIAIEYGGARYPKSVECAPQRRVDLALRYMTQGAYHRCFNSKKGIIQCLAEEIISASKLGQSSNAITKKLETERQADSSR